MNLILLTPDDFVAGGVTGDGRVRLVDRRRDYVVNVHRAEVGDTLRVGLIDDRMGTGRIVRLDAEQVELEVELDQEPPAKLACVLVLALPRPLVLKRTLLHATAFGVERIVLLQSRRVERSFWNSTALREPALREQLLLGLEQARDTRVPEVSFRMRFRPFVEDELPALCEGSEGLVADPDAKEPCPRGATGPVTLAVGPEGGFVPYEVERLVAAGLRPVAMGQRVLRVETAVPALLGRLF